jgi:peptidoglycan/LPS O-acetylase OafA/YrhL
MGLIRTLLAIIVVFAHSPFGTIFFGGELAVQTFYMISGFLIAHVIRNNPAYRDIRNFYINRALKIFPIYYVVAALTAVYALFFDRTALYVFAQTPFAAKILLTISQLTIFGQDWVMFCGIRDGELHLVSNFRESIPQLWRALLVPQAWTLGVELSFYAIAPFILRYNRLIIILFFFSCAIRIFTVQIGLGLHDPWTYRFFPSELSIFLLGSLSNIYLLPIIRTETTAQHKGLVFTAGGTLTFITVCALYNLMPFEEHWRHYLVLVLGATILPLAFSLQKYWKVDSFIGELSYPIYICHFLILWVLASVFAHAGVRISALTHSIVLVTLSIGFAYVLHKTVSERIERLRFRIRSPTPAS